MSIPWRWITPSGRHSPELVALIELARAGEPWADIGATFYPPASGNSYRKACDIFKTYASELDRTERREALARRGFNRLGKGGPPPKPIAGEPPLKLEQNDPWAGMGNCFRSPPVRLVA